MNRSDSTLFPRCPPLVAAGLLALTLLSACARPSPPSRPSTPTSPNRAAEAPRQPSAAPRWGLVIHGGAGQIAADRLSPEHQAEYRATLEAALRAGHRALERGESSLDAVVAAITVLEDSPRFNAGKGAVFDHDGKNELDAAIMDGQTLMAGAVAGVQRVKNPILLARRVMEKTPHVMLIGAGAEQFAEAQGIELVDPSYFYTEERWRELQRALDKERDQEKHGHAPSAGVDPREDAEEAEHKYGTVGAVALDRQGRLAAGTSTGGLTNKRFGRVGDSPIVGAGTYASPGCAVSGTGHGEFFIRYTVAYDICARVRYQGAPLEAAANAVVMDELAKAGGEGGIIAMDGEGRAVMVFNTKSMFRGHVGPDGVPSVAVFRERPGAR